MLRYVQIGMMYRDGCNYKNGCSWLISYDDNMMRGEVIEALRDLWEPDNIVPSYFGLRTISPIESEYEIVGNDYDHAFIEVDEPEYWDWLPINTARKEFVDIHLLKIIDTMQKLDRKAVWQEVKSHMLDHIKYIDNELGV